MELPRELKHFIDADGNLTKFPKKQRPRMLALAYLAGFFEPDKRYTEMEVNVVLMNHHSFQDHTMLRRELYDRGFLGRERDGSAYWLEEKQPEMPE